ncbi:hypothetical protein BD324DRAFT_344191 [Kockovaella imperatae]|uniref:Uncharacterized protein n=1 Tax=Kockovaella imperatae TaxID=4999 RepID=A0A1Y1UJJ0_9TREE|nr:hypothetical protein BD324DRAFT_344191 [Kockovaella imperatae]ORX38230.1 hypothetical protein BD324DRAFT_344191 [Kockovaella imperatae]
MKRSPSLRKSRRGLAPFAPTPSRLSHSTSAHELRNRHNLDDDEEADEDEVEKLKPQDEPRTDQGIQTGSFKFSQGSSAQQTTPGRFSTPIRNRSIGTGGLPASPRTPEIHYSPFATSTPPSGLSKSTSVPFDMAANDKAARRLDVELRQKKEITPTPRKKRFVRRKPLLERIAAYPQQLADMWLLNWPPSFENISPPAHYANPIALGTHVLHWLVLAPLLRREDEPQTVLRDTSVENRWSRFDDDESSQRSNLAGWKTFIFTLLLITLTSANSIYLFTRYRTYDMQLRSVSRALRAHSSTRLIFLQGRDAPVSPHASPVSTPHAPRRDSDINDLSSNNSSKVRSSLIGTIRAIKTIIVWAYTGILAIFGHHAAGLGNGFGAGQGGDTIQRLRVWEPPDFALHFFCAYPPSAPLLSYLLAPIHPFLTPFLHLITSFLLTHLAGSYSQFVKDRMVLSAEVMREYDQRFVYRKVFAPRVDRGVGTHDGPWYDL